MKGLCPRTERPTKRNDDCVRNDEIIHNLPLHLVQRYTMRMMRTAIAFRFPLFGLRWIAFERGGDF